MADATFRLSRTILPLFALVTGFASSLASGADPRVSESYGKLPLHFEANQGQTHEDVRFLARGSGYSLYLTAGEAVLVLTRPDPDGKQNGRSTPERRAAPAQAMPAVLRMSIVGAAPAPLVSGREELPGKTNYFVGKDPAKWRTNVRTYAKVHYREVYPGIDLVYYGNQRQLEYDFVVAPGADPKKIVLGFKGAEKLEIDAEGELVLHVHGGAIRQKKPVIYQEIEGSRHKIAGSYIHKGANRVGFKVAAYDTSWPLIIDPVVLSYSTYLGGSQLDGGRAIAVDADGNAYVTGSARANFPTTAGAFQPAFGGGSDAFVTKLNATGSALVYSTYLSGSFNAEDGTGVTNTDEGTGIAVDAEGNAYVTGFTGSADFPTTPGAFQTASAGPWEAFVTKLNPTGSGLVYSTYLGGSFIDGGSGIAVDSEGNAYVTGSSQSSDFPTTPGALQPTLAGCCGAFVAKLNPAGSALVYSTYLSGAGGSGIAVDADGNAYVTGYVFSIDFPTTLGAFQPIFGGGEDAFVTKLNPTGSGLVYSSYLGGSDRDSGRGIALDSDRNAYVTGTTLSTDFPTTPGAFQPTRGGSNDAFVTKVNPTGSGLVYSTYLGGSKEDIGSAIAVDRIGNVYVTGRTGAILVPGCCDNTNDFPTTPGAFQPTYGGDRNDAFVTKLNPNGSLLVYSSYLGGSSDDEGFGIALNAAGNAYVTGSSWSTDFPTTAGAFQPIFGGGGQDAFVAKITDVGETNSTTRFEESAATYTGRWTSYGAETGTFSGGTILASNEIGATATFSFIGTAVTWIGVKCAICGIATVSIDGGFPYVVNTTGPAGSNFTSEPVFSASGLDPAVTHTMVFTVTGTSTSLPSLLTGGNHIAVDAFDVTQ